MKTRIDYRKAAPDAFKAMLDLEAGVRRAGLEHSLIELVKMRVSQVNGCGYCLDMHSKDARAAGETEQRLYLLSAWREAPFYSQRERAALSWAEFSAWRIVFRILPKRSGSQETDSGRSKSGVVPADVPLSVTEVPTESCG